MVKSSRAILSKDNHNKKPYLIRKWNPYSGDWQRDGRKYDLYSLRNCLNSTVASGLLELEIDENIDEVAKREVIRARKIYCEK